MSTLHLLCFFLLWRPCLAVPPGSSHDDSADKLNLLSFKFMLLDPAGSLASWNSSNNVCSWRGVVCGRRHPKRVIMLQMNSFSLAGRISPFVGNLSFIRELDLGNNHLEGQIPEELGQLRRLQVLNLSSNLLEGSIPTALGRCTQLLHLDLGINHLQGELPLEIGSLKNIVYLKLYSNDLSGHIPHSIANLSMTKTLDLGKNAFSGTFPSFLNYLPHLSALSFEFNNLSGDIHPSLWNSSTLKGFSVAGNVLAGTMPPNAFNNLPLLQVSYMEKNQFHGRIPASVGNASDLSKIQLDRNFFSGNVPLEVGKLKHLQNLVLYGNFLEAIEPIDWKFLTALTNCSQLQYLLLQTNRFGGMLPGSISNLSTLLVLSLGDNTISGSIPKGMGNLINLQGLDLSSNNFTGALPSSLAMLQSLHAFDVTNNMLHGPIPLAIGNLTELNYLDFLSNKFSGTIPSTLGNLTNLLELTLANNNLTGSIPSEILNIRTLSTILDLSFNQLEGSIAAEIGNLNNLVELHLESNKLSGEIPATLGDCQLLRNLYLENNFFGGTLPSALSKIKGLESLDLSGNNFSGHIPEFLGSLSSLYYLNLSFNNFAGEVPTSGVFENGTAISIQGNDELCGGMPYLHLPTCSSELSKKRHKFPVIPVVIPLVATLGVLLLLYFSLTWHKKKSSVENLYTRSIQGHPLLSYSLLVKATDGFSTTNLLGTGTFGSVFKGTLEGSSGENANIFAVKVLKLQTPGAVKSFEAECEAMRNLRHRNLVKIITSCSSIDSKGDDFKAIVFEFMPNGSLEHWLHPGKGNQLEQRRLNLHQIVSIILDVAYALDYLHWHGAAPIVHCDLKPSNVLLDADMVAHVGDFGLARILAEGCTSFQPSTSSMGFRGTIGYAPPEYGAGNMVSTCGDVYSYGILIHEMVTGIRPTDNIFEHGLSLRKYVERAIDNQVTDIINVELVTELENDNPRVDGGPNRKKLDSLISLLKLGMLCSEETPSSRMSTKDIIKELHAIRKAVT